MKYSPARGSEAVVCWILIAACVAIIAVALAGWLAETTKLSWLEVLLPVLGIFGATARLRGWAPPPKGGAGGGGP
ncbi:MULTISPECIES: hypothetical protein [unclassified Wenzhouxiangella]|uniref:hypothetical protein n=1 Tax=unclassified Wenzhouxiangella TaxID=2613841 RepID=UPI000E32B013|nr:MULTISPECIES: hypothetical protein [unclassified Wenzhouxiangella]RFF26882.1 hypothetical protein DZK25_10990 [Wenzhouxiangella sp. 15181]RFP68464.1 hypothetical protein DZK26_07195 [Wenzhouxiangella sp. 15190]